MSHFSVLVIGDHVEKQLAPYHEFECTGRVDEYVIEVDKTEEAREHYLKDKEVRVKGPDGALHNRFTPEGSWDLRFSQVDPEAPPYDKGRRIEFIPEGYERVEVPTRDCEPFAQWAADYYGTKTVEPGAELDLEGAHQWGYVRLNADGEVDKVVRRTNPNAEWDWYQIGGRWSGMMKLKPNGVGLNGERSWTNRDEPRNESNCDQAQKKDIDFEGMRNAAGLKAQQKYAKIADFVTAPYWLTWDEVCESFNDDEEQGAKARDVYWNQAGPKAIKEALGHSLWGTPDRFRCTLEEYVQRARDGAVATYAVIKDGQWYSKGKMGWWGNSNEHMTQEEWNTKVNAMIDELPDDTLLSIVDCHI